MSNMSRRQLWPDLLEAHQSLFLFLGTQENYNSQLPLQLGWGHATGSGQWNVGSNDVASSGQDMKRLAQSIHSQL